MEKTYRLLGSSPTKEPSNLTKDEAQRFVSLLEQVFKDRPHFISFEPVLTVRDYYEVAVWFPSQDTIDEECLYANFIEANLPKTWTDTKVRVKNGIRDQIAKQLENSPDLTSDEAMGR